MEARPHARRASRLRLHAVPRRLPCLPFLLLLLVILHTGHGLSAHGHASSAAAFLLGARRTQQQQLRALVQPFVAANGPVPPAQVQIPGGAPMPGAPMPALPGSGGLAQAPQRGILPNPIAANANTNANQQPLPAGMVPTNQPPGNSMGTRSGYAASPPSLSPTTNNAGGFANANVMLPAKPYPGNSLAFPFRDRELEPRNGIPLSTLLPIAHLAPAGFSPPPKTPMPESTTLWGRQGNLMAGGA